MAFRNTVTTSAAVTVGNAYHRVECISHPSKNEMTFHLRLYVMVNAKDEIGNNIETPHEEFFHEKVISCPFVISDESAWHQAYLYLKGLQEYAESIDC